MLGIVSAIETSSFCHLSNMVEEHMEVEKIVINGTNEKMVCKEANENAKTICPSNQHGFVNGEIENVAHGVFVDMSTIHSDYSSIINGDEKPNGQKESTSLSSSDDDSKVEDTSEDETDINANTHPCSECPAGGEAEPTSKKDASNEKKNNEDKPEVPLKYMDVKILIPGISESVSVQLSNHDTVLDVRQMILEKPECCYRTCFSLQLNGKRLDDFTELHDISGLKEDSVIKVVDEPYSVREARIHIRRLRDLLVTTLEPNAFTATDNMSLSFCTAITGIDVEEEVIKGTKDAQSALNETVLPSEQVILEKGAQISLEPLLINSKEVQVPQCLKDLRYSAWNPPPGSRKLAGDLLYLSVKTLEDNSYHVTCSSTGFYVNKSTDDEFNPTPQSEFNRGQTLVAVLNQLSPLFKKNFASLQRISTKKHPLELVASPLQVFPWISPRFEHTADPFRAEDAVTSRIGYEEQIPGQLRDWNEELQSAKELPKKTLHQRILRDRALYKITCDFVAAATRGAVAVVDGNVMAINPGEDEKMRMYIWNNIFFSFACDSREHYLKYGGDEAAYAAAALDLKGVEAYNKLDIDGLHTLGTVVVDYRGYRIVAQSIIPGILQREQENSVVYGSVDGGKTIAGHQVLLEKLKEAGKLLKLRPHKVINEKNEEVELCSSIECKGIVGADGRHYILDLFRTFPPDVNFLDVPKAERLLIDGENISDKGDQKTSYKFPIPHRHQLCALRPTLIEAFIGFKYVSFVKVIAIHKMHDDKLKLIKFKQGESQNEAAGSKDGSSSCEEVCTGGGGKGAHSPPKSEEAGSQDEPAREFAGGLSEPNSAPSTSKDASEAIEGEDERKAKDAKAREAAEEEEIKADILAATRAIGSLSDTEFDIRFNPDAHVKEIKLAESEAEITKREKALIEDAAVFLAETVVPKLVDDFSALICSPIDGIALTEIMHSRGISMRYLGQVAILCQKKDNLDTMFKIVVKEMVLRSAKRQFKACLQSVNQRCLSLAVSHFLNCFLSSASPPQPHAPADEFNSKKKKNKKKTQKPAHLPANSNVAWLSVSPASLWSLICENTRNHFGFDIQCVSVDEFVSKFSLQKVSLLRELCRKTGIQMLLREYDFNNRKAATFTEADILNLFPVVKTVTPKATDASAIFDASQSRLQAGFIGDAHELMIEALNMFNQVYGPLHPDIVVCYRAIARIHYLADDAVQAVCYQKKAVIVAERIYGIDHPETLVSYVHLALYCYHAGLVSASLKLMYRARYLALLSFGEDHPDMATFDTNIGLMLHNQREFNHACKFLERAVGLQVRYHGKDSLHTATGHHLVARVLTAMGEYKTALNFEKATFGIYQKHFGKEDARTKESSEALKAILNQAVMLQKTLRDISEKGTINPGRMQPIVDDDKKILSLVNKIDEVIKPDGGSVVAAKFEELD